MNKVSFDRQRITCEDTLGTKIKNNFRTKRLPDSMQVRLDDYVHSSSQSNILAVTSC